MKYAVTFSILFAIGLNTAFTNGKEQSLYSRSFAPSILDQHEYKRSTLLKRNLPLLQRRGPCISKYCQKPRTKSPPPRPADDSAEAARIHELRIQKAKQGRAGRSVQESIQQSLQSLPKNDPPAHVPQNPSPPAPQDVAKHRSPGPVKSSFATATEQVSSSRQKDSRKPPITPSPWSRRPSSRSPGTSRGGSPKIGESTPLTPAMVDAANRNSQSSSGGASDSSYKKVSDWFDNAEKTEKAENAEKAEDAEKKGKPKRTDKKLDEHPGSGQ